MSDGSGSLRDLAFVSYSHSDKVWLDRLQILLKPYVRAGQLRVWVDPVSAGIYSPDGSLVLSASGDQCLKIWSTGDGRCLHTVYGRAAFACVAATRGQFVAGDGLGNMWILDCDLF